MSKLKLSALPLLLFIVLLSSCSDTPIKPEKKPVINQQIHIADTAQKRLALALQRFNQSMTVKQPEKNQQLLSIIDFLLQADVELNIPDIKEYQLISELLNAIELNYLTLTENNHFFINQIKLKLYHQQNQQAEVLLAELHENLSKKLQPPLSLDKKTIDLQKIEYHFLAHQFLINTSQPLAAIKELIAAQPLLKIYTTPLEQNEHLNYIWELMNTFQLKTLQLQVQQLAIQNEQTDNLFGKQDEYFINFQLGGWQELIYTIKSSSQYSKIIHLLALWFDKYPHHMVNKNFILERLQQHFKALTNPQHIALLLPAKGKLSKPAKVLINGFFAAHFEQPINTQLLLRIYDSSQSDSIWPSYQTALDNGADMIIGPFNKKYIAQLQEVEQLPIPTLALNHVENPVGHRTVNLYQFALTPEDEIQVITEKAKQNGFTRAALITPENKWGKRLKRAYLKKWKELGGIMVSTQTYPAKTYDYSEQLKQLLLLGQSNKRRDKVRQTIGHDVDFTPRRRQDIDVIFMAAFPKQAKQIPLQITYNYGADIPVYATSQIMSKPFNDKENLDLNGITYTDMPWLLDSSVVAISRLNKQKYTVYKRLFAFGVDSYQILPYLKLMSANSSEQFNGDTGNLSINNSGYVIRKLPTATIKKGKAIAN